MKYLDPKNDLIFKRIFGEHPNILLSFLNALLPLESGNKIIQLENLPPELVPEVPLMKNSIVDVRCMDNFGRQFIVEMQMLWTDSFKNRVLFNASKAFVGQLEKSEQYKELQPVYALSIVNENFEHWSTEYYHHYKITHDQNSEKILDGLQLIFIELPKFKAKNFNDKRIQFLWLEFLSQLKMKNEMYPQELLDVPEIKQAIELTKASGYTQAELAAYDKYWDSIRVEKTFIADAISKGKLEGISIGKEVGKEEGISIGKEVGKEESTLAIAKKMKSLGMSNEKIAEITGLTIDQINSL